MMISSRSAAAARLAAAGPRPAPPKVGNKRVRIEQQQDPEIFHLADTTGIFEQQDFHVLDTTGTEADDDDESEFDDDAMEVHDFISKFKGKRRKGKDIPSIIYWALSAKYSRILKASGLRSGPIDPHDDPKQPIVLRRYTAGRELGDLTAAIPRENVLHFFYPHSLEVGGRPKAEHDLSKLKMRRDLFLLAFASVQSLPSSDKWSFYQIAGIHGLPHVPYDGATGPWDPSSSDWWGGYCQHGSPLFPTWHRPYVMLLEQSIIRQAKRVAEALSDGSEKEAAAKLAEELRLPYWDWADHTSRILGLPDVFTTTEISLAYPWKSMARRSIPNPLKSFVLPENVGTPMASSDVFNPAAKPHYKVPADGTPFIPLGYPTVRHVSPAYNTQNDKLNVTLLRNAETLLVEGVHAVFHHDDWLSFSNHYWSGSTDQKSTKQYGHYSSLELVHDMLHDTVGGTGGQMSYPETAGFDPIFFFHHCNVDRLLALWQYCYPTAWIPSDSTDSQRDSDGTFTEKPDSVVDASTPLTPFRCSPDTFVCSNDVRTVDLDCGYSYPELVRARKEQWLPARMLYYVLHLYDPPQHFIHKWFLVLERIRKGAFSGPYSIRVFLDLPNADASTPISSPHYAGSVFVFARNQAGINAGGGVVRCANCEVRPFMRATLELTPTMLRLGITTAPEMTGDDGSIQANPQRNPLAAEGAIKLVYVNQKGEALPDLPPNAGGPKLTIVYQEGVPNEMIYEFLIAANNATITSGAPRVAAGRAQPINIDDILRQNHKLPKNPVHAFSLTD